MAKKKGGKGKGNAAEAANSPTNSGAPEPENSGPVAEASLSEEPSVTQVTESAPAETTATSSNSATGGADAEQLRKELAAAKAEIDALKAEVARLKASQTVAAAVDTGKTTDLDALTQRIAKLKAEQAEADAARDAAWKQLKNVVADIARLAAPDQTSKAAAGTPTAAAAAAGTFAAA
ncbi:hypothetical protein HYH02_014092 [Chlamydomonas schloesseri]|uniref:Uncharacterized protein n=1 Tax=Chlamydomonas schloesseri TaxID=2026947 RepID=A0A835SQF9_9CHLO|nr:hypothetical protein HYH02_014092 [Chlamydomonas schloesseri]|eukprot:KAG2429437.1 hypothetical protein HYH02_014092 [Chlamydomonas schloesseri]